MEKVKVDADELAFGIQFTMQFPENRSLTFTTAFPQNCDDGDLRQLLRRMSNAADFLDSTYRLRALRLHIERTELDLVNSRQQMENIRVRHMQDFEQSGRKGIYRPSGSQQKELANFSSTQTRLTEMIKKLREEEKELAEQVAK